MGRTLARAVILSQPREGLWVPVCIIQPLVYALSHMRLRHMGWGSVRTRGAKLAHDTPRTPWSLLPWRGTAITVGMVHVFVTDNGVGAP